MIAKLPRGQLARGDGDPSFPRRRNKVVGATSQGGYATSGRGCYFFWWHERRA